MPFCRTELFSISHLSAPTSLTPSLFSFLFLFLFLSVLIWSFYFGTSGCLLFTSFFLFALFLILLSVPSSAVILAASVLSDAFLTVTSAVDGGGYQVVRSKVSSRGAGQENTEPILSIEAQLFSRTIVNILQNGSNDNLNPAFPLSTSLLRRMSTFARNTKPERARTLNALTSRPTGPSAPYLNESSTQS